MQAFTRLAFKVEGLIHRSDTTTLNNNAGSIARRRNGARGTFETVPLADHGSASSGGGSAMKLRFREIAEMKLSVKVLALRSVGKVSWEADCHMVAHTNL